MYEKIALKKEIKFKLDLPYAIYEPENRDGSPLPLIVFLHGAGERDENLAFVDRYGPLKAVKNGEHFPFIVAAPQCGNDKYWGNYLESLNFWLNEIIEKYNVDTKRIYLTGLSMGGTGCWHWLLANPERFAAAAPVCGTGVCWYACRIPNKPIWVFHGDADTVVPISESKTMVEFLRKSGGNPKFTVFPGVGHNAWDYAYNRELYDWFLEHSL